MVDFDKELHAALGGDEPVSDDDYFGEICVGCGQHKDGMAYCYDCGKLVCGGCGVVVVCEGNKLLYFCSEKCCEASRAYWERTYGEAIQQSRGW